MCWIALDRFGSLWIALEKGNDKDENEIWYFQLRRPNDPGMHRVTQAREK
jgi:hypothetical protein